MIVQLAGLPGTGKSSLAAALQEHYGSACLVLDKDRVRSALYARSGHVDYDRGQDDFVVSLLHRTADRFLARQADGVVVLERTCARSYQIDDVVQLAARLDQPLAVIRCWCPDHVARARLDADRRDVRHPAGNRSYALYQRLKAAAEPIAVPALHLRTDTTRPRVLSDALTYLSEIAAEPVPATAAREDLG